MSLPAGTIQRPPLVVAQKEATAGVSVVELSGSTPKAVGGNTSCAATLKCLRVQRDPCRIVSSRTEMTALSPSLSPCRKLLNEILIQQSTKPICRIFPTQSNTAMQIQIVF